MTKNAELLNYIYQNSKMGQDSIAELVKSVPDTSLKSVLNGQFSQYKAINARAVEILNASNKSPKEISGWLQISTYISINMHTMMDNSNNAVAKMMIQGSNMGIVEITEKLNDYENADAEIKALANRLLKHEQSSIEQLKKFL